MYNILPNDVLCKNISESIAATDDGMVRRIKTNSGEITLTEYSVFPGIDIVFSNADFIGAATLCGENESVFVINHCKEGRVEFENGGSYCYLASGDLSVTRVNGAFCPLYFPLGGYCGVSILIYPDKTPPCLSCFLADVDVSPSELVNKFSSLENGYISRSDKGIEHIFSELYSVPPQIRRGYFKVKILELLMFLSNLEISPEETTRHMVSKRRADLAKSIGVYLVSHMDERITLNALSSEFHVSGTGIKSAFKEVYGVSVYSYIRTRKMQAAALSLKNTDRNILDIAGSVGYDNGSKFAKAFRDVFGVSPKEYRKSARAAA